MRKNIEISFIKDNIIFFLVGTKNNKTLEKVS